MKTVSLLLLHKANGIEVDISTINSAKHFSKANKLCDAIIIFILSNNTPLLVFYFHTNSFLSNSFSKVSFV